MGIDWVRLLLAAVLLLLPAIVVFAIANARRIRAQKAHRQRITKRRSHSPPEDKPGTPPPGTGH